MSNKTTIKNKVLSQVCIKILLSKDKNNFTIDLHNFIERIRGDSIFIENIAFSNFKTKFQNSIKNKTKYATTVENTLKEHNITIKEFFDSFEDEK